MSTFFHRLSGSKKYIVDPLGNPFFYLADTWWFGATSRMSFDVFKKLATDRKEKGFTVVQIVVGVPPEVEIFSKNASNSGGLPFNKDLSLNLKYFEEIDKKIEYLTKIGLMPCILGGWGYHVDLLGEEIVKNLWGEIIKRYSKYPVIYCLCGEVDSFLNPTPLSSKSLKNAQEKVLKTFPFLSTSMKNALIKTKQGIFSRLEKRNNGKLLRDRLEKWDRIGNFVKNLDPRHLVTVHTGMQTTAQKLFPHSSWLSLNTFQSGHVKDSVGFMTASIRSNKDMPIINMEPWYEGIGGNFGPEYQRLAFWACVLSGAAGHAYGAHGLWQMSKKRENFMGHWGKSDYEKALSFKGALQLGKSAWFLQKYEWWKLSPLSNNLDFFFSAAIDKKQVFVYIPTINSVKNTISLPFSKSRVEAINPETLTKIGSEVLTKDIFTVQLKNNEDRLYIISKSK